MVKNRILVAVGLVASFVGGGIALGFITGAESVAPGGSALALSSGDTGSVSCAGQSISVVPQSPTSLTVTCDPNLTNTTTTTIPPSTTNTQPITTTTTTAPNTTTTQPASPGQTLLGLWNNGTSASALGVTARVYSDYAFDPNETTYSASAAKEANGKVLMLGVGALTPNQATAIGQELVAGGQPDAILRPMWEMNQASWFTEWNENAMSAATYKATWIAMVNAFRAVPGTDFKFDYNINAGDTNNVVGRSTFDSYPGNAYVDYIGIDIYDWYGTLPIFQADITEAANFAQVMQLPLTIPEWGLASNEDDPAFVNLIHSNCDTSSCYEEGLFAGLSSGPGTPLPPASVAAYQADFG